MWRTKPTDAKNPAKKSKSHPARWRTLLLAPLVALVGLALLLVSAQPVLAGGVCDPAPVVLNDGDVGADTLRAAIDSVCSGGVITFVGERTILLNTPLLIMQDLTIDGPGDGTVTISGNNTTRLMYVN